MFQPSTAPGSASSAVPLPSYRGDVVRHILLGEYGAVMGTIHALCTLGYCERLQWAKPIPTGRNGEYLSIITRRVLPEG